MARDMMKMVERLNDLIALDTDAVYAYKVAIEAIEVTFLKDKLREFQQDHERHIRELSEVVSRMGGKPRERRDLKGFVLQGFTAITAQMGTEAALKAMQANEKLTNRTYQRATAEELPADIMGIIARNFTDEQRHLRYIEDALRTRSWEQAAPVQQQ